MTLDADVGGGKGQTDPVLAGVAPSPADVSAGLYACVVCAENVPRFGSTCDRCRASMDEDRLERESNR